MTTLPLNILSCLERQASTLGGRLALTHRNVAFSFADLSKHSRQLANALLDEGLGCTDAVHVESCDLNWCSCFLAYLGITSAGMVAILSRRSESPFRGYPSLILDTEEGVRFHLSREREDATGPVGVGRLLPRPLDVVFSSGSAGEKKPYLFGQSHITDGMSFRSPRLEVRGLHFGVPFPTATGVHGIALRHLFGGISSICIDRPADWAELASSIGKFKVFEASTTPFALDALVRSHPGLELPSRECELRVLRAYAGPLPEHTYAELKRRLPRCHIISIYGLTEAGTSSLVSSTAEKTFSLPHGETGADLFRTWIDDGGRWAEPQEVGEIVAKVTGSDGPPLCLLSTPPTPMGPDGWVRTGDLGWADGGGRITFIGRANDILILNAERGSAREIEERLSSLLRVTGILAFNAPPPRADSLCLVVEGSREPSDIAHVGALRTVASHAIVLLVDGIDRTELGKAARVLTIKKALPYLEWKPAISAGPESSMGAIDIIDARAGRTDPAHSRSAPARVVGDSVSSLAGEWNGTRLMDTGHGTDS